MVKKRINIWVSPEFNKMIQEIQKDIMKTKGKKISTVDISTDLLKEIDLQKIQDKLLKGDKLNGEFRLRLE